MTAKLTIGVTAWSMNDHKTAPELAEQAEIAEALEFHSFWLPESHFAGNRSLPCPLMLLAAIASRTNRIRLATTSYLLPIRHPIQAAEEVAVLDRLSGGRVILGIGRGIQDAMFSVFEVDPKLKRKRFSSALGRMIAAWAGEPIARISRGEVEEPVYLSPLPLQKPHPPLWVAAFGPLALKQAAGFGLPYLASPMETWATLERNYDLHRQHLAASQHQPLDTLPIMRMVFVSKDRHQIETVREQTHRSAVATGRLQPGDSIDDWALIGDPDQVLAGIEQCRARFGMTHLIASGRVLGMDADDYVSSLRLLAELRP